MTRQHGRQRVTPRSARARVREQQALELRIAGYTYQQIGDAVGITAQAAHKAVARAVARTAAHIEQDAETLRALEIERLDRLMAAIWPRAMRADLGAVDKLLKALSLRYRLLGLGTRPPEATVPTQQVVVQMYPEDANL